MVNFYLLSCAVLAVIVFSQSVDAAVIKEFDEQTQQVQPYNEFSGDFNDVIDEPKDDEIDEPEEYGLQFLSNEPEQRPGLDWWNSHVYYHYHHDDDHHEHYHHGHYHHEHYHHGHYHHEHDERSCTCRGKNCSCCVHDHNYHIHIDGKEFILSACVDVIYLHETDEYEIGVTLNNRKVLTERTVDLKHPPSLCYTTGIRAMKKACVEFYDVSSRHGCVKLTGKISSRHFSTSVDLQLGCFTIPASEIDE